MIKKLDQSVEHEIVQWEEKAWMIFQEKLKPLQEGLKSIGLDLFLERYWGNVHKKTYEEYNERIDFVDGYHFCCRYSIKKDGKMFVYRQDLETYAMYIFELTHIKCKLPFSGLCYQLGIFKKRPLYVELTEFSSDFEKNVQDDIEEDLEGIRQGNYILEES